MMGWEAILDETNIPNVKEKKSSTTTEFAKGKTKPLLLEVLSRKKKKQTTKPTKTKGKNPSQRLRWC